MDGHYVYNIYSIISSLIEYSYKVADDNNAACIVCIEYAFILVTVIHWFGFEHTFSIVVNAYQ